jgi:hypothetical protein
MDICYFSVNFFSAEKNSQEWIRNKLSQLSQKNQLFEIIPYESIKIKFMDNFKKLEKLGQLGQFILIHFTIKKEAVKFLTVPP